MLTLTSTEEEQSINDVFEAASIDSAWLGCSDNETQGMYDKFFFFSGRTFADLIVQKCIY